MLSLVLFSCGVSLVTLGILLFQRNVPQRREIPSAHLGSRKASFPVRLKVTKPPLLLWALIALATLGAALAYYPQLRPTLRQKDKAALVFVDTSFSATLARIENKVEATDILQSLSFDSYQLFGIRSSLTESGTPAYNLIELNSPTAVTDYVKEQFAQGPSSFAVPVDVNSLAAVLKEHPLFSERKGTLLVVSDGQSDTMQGLALLKSSFGRAELVSLPPATTLVGQKTEIVPADIISLWTQTKTPNAQDFLEYDGKSQTIPDQARPHLFRETFQNEGNPFQLVTLQLGVQTQRLPMLTGCSLQAAGPHELNAFADIEAIAHFFSAVTRVQACQDQGVRSSEDAAGDPWKYRTSTIWLVMADEEVLNTLTQRLWIPQGFVPGADAVVYVASSKLISQERSLLSRVPVQLDEGSMHVPLILMPPPPEGELMGLEEKPVRFQTIFESADKTPLGYQAGNSAVYYLRTTAAMPNGELGRSSRWIDFWLALSKKLNMQVPSLRQYEFRDSQQYAPLATELSPLIESEKLDEKTLRFTKVTEKRLAPGLYRSNGNLALVSVPASERSKSFVAGEEFEKQWNAESGEQVENTNRSGHGRTSQSLFGAILGCLSLAFFWWTKTRRAAVALLFVTLLTAPLQGEAQFNLFPNRRMPRSFGGGPSLESLSARISPPYRVAWCDAEIPASIKERYKQMRDTLAARGTIHMPDEMLAGACRAGAAEIWWSADPAAFQMPQIQEHISSGGVFVLEGQNTVPPHLRQLEDPSIGLQWEAPPKRGMFYRSFYLLQSFDGCVQDSTRALMLRKKSNAHSPVGVVTSARFLTLSQGPDCFATDEDYRSRSFVNLMYSFFATDYKEDQLQLPEILNRVRNLGLEP